MRSISPFAVRLHALLIRTMLPRLGTGYAEQASAAFQELRHDAGGGPVHRARLWLRELRALVATAMAERREGRGRTRRPHSSHPGAGNDRPTNRRVTKFADSFSQDFRYALRNLIRTPGFAVGVVLSLALGIGAATTVFSAVNMMFLRSAPHVRAPQRLVSIYTGDRIGVSSYPDFLDYRAQTPALANAAAYKGDGVLLAVAGYAPRAVVGQRVSESYFEVLGIPMVHGRGFVPEDGTSSIRVAVIGFGVWQSDFGGDPAVLAETVRIDGVPHHVVGVAPPGTLTSGGPFVGEVWYPIAREERINRGLSTFQIVGRMRDGATIEEVQAQLDLVATRLKAEYPVLWDSDNGSPQRIRVESERAARVLPELRGGIAAALAMLMLVVILVLAIACSNVANLLMTRAAHRRSEIAVRVALGAGRRRLMTQLLTESGILAAAAGVLGFAFSYWLTELVARSRIAIGGLRSAGAMAIEVDGRVALFATAVALATGLVFGLAPALQASRPDLLPALKGLGQTGRSRRFGPRNLLVTVQVTGSLVFLACTGLLVRSLQEAGRVDVGFDPENVAVLTLDVGQRQYAEAAGRRFYADLAERLRGVAGVEGVALARLIPLGSEQWSVRTEIQGYDPQPGEVMSIALNRVSPGYFDLIRLPLMAGRDFTAVDDAAAPSVAIVNQAFADRYWPGENPIGKRVSSSEVVGVVRDAHLRGLSGPSMPHIWQPFAQHYTPLVRVHVRTEGDPTPLFRTLVGVVRTMDASLPIINTSQMKDLVSFATKMQQLASMVLGMAGVVALTLAVMGIYSVMAFAVSQRTREVGIRVALGAHPHSVVRMIVWDGLTLSAAGLLVGVGLVAVVANVARALLVGVSPVDPVSLLGAVALLVSAAAAASAVPALRAARVDPMVALRAE